MKKVLLLLSLFFVTASYAQVIVPKGKRVLGGTFSAGTGYGDFDTSINGDGVNVTSSYQFGFNPSLGWAKKDNQLYGVLIYSSFYHWKGESSNSITKGSSSIIGPGVFYERFFQLGKGFHFSANGTLRASYGITKDRRYVNNVLISEGKGKRYDANFSVTPRIGYSINKKWMIQTSIGEMLNLNYSHTTWKHQSGGNITQTDYNNFSVNTELNRGFSISNMVFTFRYSF